MRSPACIQDTDRSSSLPKDSERPALRGQEQSPPCGRTKFPAAPATPDSFPARKATKTGKDNKTGIHFTGQPSFQNIAGFVGFPHTFHVRNAIRRSTARRRTSAEPASIDKRPRPTIRQQGFFT